MNRLILAKQRYLREQNKSYSPTLQLVDKSEWPNTVFGMGVMPEQVFRSRQFLVQQFPPKNGAIRLSIIRTMMDGDGQWVQGFSWDELQDIKRECGYGNWCALEIFPPDLDVVNVANMRHLWLVSDLPEFAWRRGGKA